MYGTLKVSIDPSTGEFQRKLATHKGTPSVDQISEAVEGRGVFTTGFRIQSATRPNVMIDFYVNDEGLLMSEIPVVMYRLGNGDVYELAGSGVFVGGDDDTGESIPLTMDEIKQLADVRMYPIGITE